jgi:hypothetical protein
VRSIQLTSAPPSTISTSTWPAAVPPSTRTGAPQLAPESSEKATFTRGVSRAAVNHAITTRLPSDERAGPLTGQAGIFQPSACTGRGSVQRPPAWRVK